MRHAAVDRDARPDHAPLLEAQLVLLGLADDRRAEPTADRGRAQVLDPEHVAFLVDERADDEAAVERGGASLDGDGRDHRRRQAALHVRGSPPVDAAVDQLGAERRVGPLGGVPLGHDVGVAFEEQARTVARFAEPRDDVRPARRHLLDFEIEPVLAEPLLDVTGDGGLGGRRIAGPDHARDPDEIAGELDQLVSVDTGQRVFERRGAARGHAGLLVREGQDDGVEADDPVLFAGDVKVVPLDFLGGLLERHDRLEIRHLAERVGALVEPVAARDDLAVADRRALRPSSGPGG